MISWTCSQPASAVARKQAKRSEKTALSATTLCLAQTLYGFACKSTNAIHLDLNRAGIPVNGVIPQGTPTPA